MTSALTATAPSAKRVLSIDVFRAVTMLTMIFVNDLWSLSGIPGWLEHARADQDFLGFSDTVFPCFLVIVGMSVPFAVQQRLAKGDTYGKLLLHIGLRSVALIIMGVFTVNISDLNEAASGMRKEWFQILMVAGFFLIWNQYPKQDGMLKGLFTGLQLFGIALLVWLAYRFKGGAADNLTGMTPQWWGILGLIGWTYLTCATLYLFLRDRFSALVVCWVMFNLLPVAGHAGWLRQLWPEGPQDWILGNGAFSAFTFTGILATRMVTRWQEQQRATHIPLYLIIAGGLFVMAGLLSRNFFLISKIQATSTWIWLCCGIALIVYAGIYWLVDLKDKAGWFTLIKPAGTSTLTCYLIPYVYYSVADLSGISLPAILTTGGVGLLKSLVYALLVIGITALLGNVRIKLKL
ncbi:DUF5009 domain-containing protein [Arsenicibacter rosenii]|uniref:DUF5009 domain-containing protein n=1 Tax=Arsenicibacter rosenii TaxID=1750698 RepID=A0A1S2VKM4_9BACT|nr:DUF5009 domain-containing protein [Arsenicibacter rosenii]OIN59321.1 hypothetical protein BLX24_10070 [Arsenicibacter rosenii]